MEARTDWFVTADVTAFYTGWTLVREGRGAALYDLDAQADAQGRLLDGARLAGGDILPYVNPPHLTLPLTPLAWLSRPAAFLVWTAAQLALLLWALRWLAGRLAADWRPVERRLLIAAVLAAPPLFATLVLGAFSLLLLVCFMRMYDDLARCRDGRAGLWLVAATIKPQIAILPGLLLLAACRWRALVVAAALGGALAAAATAAFGWGIWGDYLRLLGIYAGWAGRMGVEPAAMWNLRGTLTLLLGAARLPLINALSLVGLALAGVATFWLWRAPWRPGAPAFQLRFALTAVLAVLASPHLNSHDGLLLVLPAALGYDILRADARQGRWFGRCALAWPLFCLLSSGLPAGSLPIQPPTAAAIGLALWLALALRRAQRGEAMPRNTAGSAAGRPGAEAA
jgi:hypothetical protein